MPKFRYRITFAGGVVKDGAIEVPYVTNALEWILKVFAMDTLGGGSKFRVEDVTSVWVERE